MFIGGYGACRSPRCDVQFSGLAFSGRPESNRRRPAWEFSAGPSRTLTPSHSSSLSRPPARDASHDFSPLLTRDGQYLGQYGLPEPVSRCPTVAADPGRARSAQRPRLGRCPRNNDLTRLGPSPYRRHAGDFTRLLLAAPARLRRAVALRWLHEREGEGRIAADRDRVSAYALTRSDLQGLARNPRAWASSGRSPSACAAIATRSV